MDFITDLPTSKGYDSILTVVDRHSKAIILSVKVQEPLKVRRAQDDFGGE